MKNDKKSSMNLNKNEYNIKIPKEKSSFNLESFSLSLSTENETITLHNNSRENENENKSHIRKLLNKIDNFIKNNKDKNLIFKCPNQFCPFIPILKYFEFTQSVSTKCRAGHEYHLSLTNYFEIIFKEINEEKFCNICLKKNYSNIKSISEFYCTICNSNLCKRCEMTHNHSHQILDLNKVNTYCPIHLDTNTKFSGYCCKCQKDLCIHCLKDHVRGHHSLIQYLELIPSKEKINSYKAQISSEIHYIDYVKNILIENNVLENTSEKKIFFEFLEKMTLKYYFYESQLQAFDKIKFNISIIKNIIDLFLVPQNFFRNIYNFITTNLNEYNKVQILNQIISTTLKYQSTSQNEQKRLKNNNKKANKYLSHFKFKPLFSINKNKNIKFLYLLKCGKFLACIENDGLYLYDDGTFVELLHIVSDTDIIDLCEDDSGLIFLLKKSMIEIIKINENYNGYNIRNKILFKTIDKANFICTITNGAIIVSRIKRNEGNLEIWIKSKIKNITSPNNIDTTEKKSKKNIVVNLPQRGRDIIDMFNNNNRRVEIVLRRTINNNNFENRQNNNIIINNNNNIINNQNSNNENNNANQEEEENNEDNNEDNNNANESIINENNENNNDINNDNNNNINEENINNINQLNINNNSEQNDKYNDNIILEEIPQPQINNIGNNNNNINNIGITQNNIRRNNNNHHHFNINHINHINLNNNNNNGINLNIIRGNNPRRLRRQNQDIQRPRFVHVIRFIRDQLQGLVNNLEQEELVLEDPSLISSVGIYGSKDPEIIHLNKVIKNGHEICALLDWDENFFICSEFHAQRKTFKYIRIYSSETFEPCEINPKIKIKSCSRDKNALFKIDKDIFGVCFDLEKRMYGISLISFKTREEINIIEMPQYNFVKKIYFNKCNYLFVLLDYFNKNNNNNDLIKVYKIIDKELIDSSSYIFEPWLNTYIYNKNNENKNIIEGSKCEKNNDFAINNENDSNIDNNLEEIKEKEFMFMNIVNSFEQNNHNGKEITSMIKLKNNSFVCLNKLNCINIYKVE